MIIYKEYGRHSSKTSGDPFMCDYVESFWPLTYFAPSLCFQEIQTLEVKHLYGYVNGCAYSLFYPKFIWLAWFGGSCCFSYHSSRSNVLYIYSFINQRFFFFFKKRKRKKNCHHSVLLVKQGKLLWIFWLAAHKLGID